jgi:predicted HNH restriction endonuclease
MNERKTIYLDDAIDALIRVRKPINNGDGTMTIMTLTDAVIRKVLEGLPSAQPMQTDKDFEKQIHAMFDHIWDCEIEHPIFQDTVGDLMKAVIQAHNNSALAVRKKGEWLELTNTNHTYVCSICGRMLVNIPDGKNKVTKNYPFCHCGADMRGEQDALN